MSKLCGEDLSTWVGHDSPFIQIVFIGYDDGPTSGAARCAANSETYRFEMLTRDVDGTYDWPAWNRGEEIRIFSLARLPGDAFRRFAEALSQEETRQRIVEGEIFYNEIYSILDAVKTPELIIASHGIRARIIAASQVSADGITAGKDWFSFLGLTPGA